MEVDIEAVETTFHNVWIAFRTETIHNYFTRKRETLIQPNFYVLRKLLIAEIRKTALCRDKKDSFKQNAHL